MKRTNIVLDENKVRKAIRITKCKTTREVVDYALTRLISTSQALGNLKKLKGRIQFDEGYDYKEIR